MKLRNLLMAPFTVSSMALAQDAKNNTFSIRENRTTELSQPIDFKSITAVSKGPKIDKDSNSKKPSEPQYLDQLNLRKIRALEAGGQDGSGGNFLKAKEQLVMRFLSAAAHSTFVEILDRVRYSLKGNAIRPITDQKAKGMLENILKLPQVKNFNFMKPGTDHKGTIQLIVNGEDNCIDKFTGQKRIASLLRDETNSPIQICISLKKLMEFPDDTFVTSKRGQFDEAHASYEVAGLVFHELAHAAGYDEDDAEYLQDYLLRKFLIHCELSIELALSEDHTPYDTIIRIAIEDHGQNANIQRFYADTSKQSEAAVGVFNTSEFLNGFEFTKERGAMTLKIGNRDGKVSAVNFSWTLNDISGPLTASGVLDGKTFTSKGFVRLNRGCFSR